MSNQQLEVSASKTVISRRTMARGAAWAVPVVAIAGSIPAYAASGTISAGYRCACKFPGNGSCDLYPKGYLFYFDVTNAFSEAVQITAISFTTAGTNLDISYTGALPITVPSGAFNLDVTVQTEASNSANQTFTATMCLTYEHVDTATGQLDGEQHVYCTSFQVPGTPPDCACVPAPVPPPTGCPNA